MVIDCEENSQEDVELLDEMISRDLFHTNFTHFNNLLANISGEKTASSMIPSVGELGLQDIDVDLPTTEIIDKTRETIFKKRGFNLYPFSSLRRKKLALIKKKLDRKNVLTTEIKRELSFVQRNIRDIKKARYTKNLLKRTLKKKRKSNNKKFLKQKISKPKEEAVARKIQSVSASFINSFQKLFFTNNYQTVLNFIPNLNWVYFFLSLSAI